LVIGFLPAAVIGNAFTDRNTVHEPIFRKDKHFFKNPDLCKEKKHFLVYKKLKM